MKSKVLEEILQKNQNSLCVFDLDSTLFNVSQRTQNILRQSLKEPSLKGFQSSHLNLLKNIVVTEKDYGLKDILKRASIHLQFDEYKFLYSFWAKYFFSNDFLKYDQIYEGACSYLNQLNQQGIEIMYLTGRHIEKMQKGTYEQIHQFGLPLKTQKHLIMKPNRYTEDAYYKKAELQKLSERYSDIWFFENEPSIINFVHFHLPQIKIVFRESSHSGHQKLQKNFLTISEFI